MPFFWGGRGYEQLCLNFQIQRFSFTICFGFLLLDVQLFLINHSSINQPFIARGTAQEAQLFIILISKQLSREEASAWFEMKLQTPFCVRVSFCFH